jgi:tRNA1Val (adenine37-N6)-methyltransferase
MLGRLAELQIRRLLPGNLALPLSAWTYPPVAIEKDVFRRLRFQGVEMKENKKENNSFHFKKFSVRHDKCTMKVGTDGVLLGAWTSIEEAKSMLDIGTGSGVIALMLAQRTDDKVKIDAIEIAEADARQAKENVDQSPWPEKIRVIHSSLTNFSIAKNYDLIVSNPPFFTNSSSPPSNGRKQARHTTGLSHNELLTAVKERLNETGKFSVILPTTEGAIFQARALDFGLYCSRRMAFYSRKEKTQERWLMEFVKQPIERPAETRLVLYEEGKEWSEEYSNLIKEFYLAI